MIEGLKPYAEYKESGQKWLGRVPAHWDVRRTKLILREVDSRSTTGKEQLLRVSQYTGVTQRKAADGSDAPDTRAASLVGYKRVSVNDLVINIMLAWNGSMGVSRFDGIASPAYCVYRLNKGAQPWYFHQLFRLPLYKGRIKAVSTGVIESRLRLYSDDLGRIEAILPPPDEQAAIVRFLDHANRKIDGFIRAKRKLIGLLNEQKQAIIHRAVTRGLHPDVPLKPSGIPWLGDIPKHWEVRKIKSLVSTYGGMTPSKGEAEYWKGTIPWVSPKDMKVREIRDSQDHISTSALRQTGIALIQPPAVLIVVRGMILARTFPTAITAVPVTINQDMKALVPKPGLSAEYFVSLLTGIQRDLLLLIEIAGHGTCCLRTDAWGSFMIPLPPLSEQNEIELHLKERLSIQNTAIARTEREIALMQEYRTRLTADLVTGKLDVREAAAHLPAPPAAAPAELVTELSADELPGEIEDEETEA